MGTKYDKIEETCDEGDGHLDETPPPTNQSTSSDKVSDGDPSAVVPDNSLKKVGDESKDHDDKVDDNDNKSHIDEGVICGHDDSSLMCSSAKVG